MIPFKGMPSVYPVQKEFEQLLEINKNQFNSIWDKELTIITNNIEIDLFKLDDILHDRFGSYEDLGLSMNNIIVKKYGEQAIELIQKCISHNII